jgi:hypothetical protein
LRFYQRGDPDRRADSHPSRRISQEFPMKDTFSVRDTLDVNGKQHVFASLTKLGERFDLKRLPYSMKILLENLLRHEDGVNVTEKEIEAIAKWDSKAEPDIEIAFMPARVVLRISPACRAWSIWPRCATRWSSSAVTPTRSIRWRPPSW